MINYLLDISYNGKDFCGWAPQPNKPSIMKAIQDAFKKFYKGEVKVYGSGRTDKGVHALHQKANIMLDVKLDPELVRRILNKHLPNAILINEVTIVDNNFHARFSAVAKEYQYILNTGKFNVFKKDIEFQCNNKLDVNAMREAASYLIGEHDFTSYCSNADGERESHVRTIFKINIAQDDERVVFDVCGNGFLRHMVRKIVGTLIVIGLGKIPPIRTREILEAKEQRACTYKAKPEGLYLVNVAYKN